MCTKTPSDIFEMLLLQRHHVIHFTKLIQPHSVKYASPLNASPTKWSNTLKQFAGNLATNFLSVFDDFVKLALKRLEYESSILSLYRKIRVTESLCSGIFYAVIDLIYH